LEYAARLKSELECMDGFISLERFQRLTDPDKMLSLSFWRHVLSCFARALDQYIINGTTVGRCLLVPLGHAIIATDGTVARLPPKILEPRQLGVA
jgi:hypothetical protein